MVDLLVLALVEICYLVTGFGLCVIGKGLIEKGFTAKFEGEGVFGKRTIRILTTSPGLVFMVAGLIVITTAIMSTSEIRERIVTGQVDGESGENSTEESERQKDQGVADLPLATLVERTRTVIFAQGSPYREFAEEQIELAKEKTRVGEHDAASTYLAIAVVIEPSLLKDMLEDKSLRTAIANPHFDAIVRSRLSLPQHLESLPVGSRPAVAEEIVKRVRGIVEAQDQGKAISDVASDIEVSIPLTPGEENREVTIRKLTRLLSLEPRLLLQVFEEKGYEWLLCDETIIDSMQSALDKYLRGQ